MALTPYELAQLQMLTPEQQFIVLTAERIMDGETSTELTILHLQHYDQIEDYINKKKTKLLFRPRKY